MHKFQKKNKDAKKQTKKETNEKVQKKVQDDEEEDEPIALNVQIVPQTQENQQPKAAKVPAKVIDETGIDYEMKNPNEGKTEVRISWVPQQGGVVKKFDYEKEKEHFVAIGQDYTPPVEQKNSNFVPLSGTTTSSTSDNRPKFTNSSLGAGNMAPMEKTAQQIKEQEMEAQLSGLRAPTLTKEQVQAKKRREAENTSILTNTDGPKKIPMFTKGNIEVNNNIAPLQKTKQQLLQQQMMANQGSFQSTAVSKEEKLAREAERKRKQEQATKIINFNSGQKKVPVFTSSANNNHFAGLKQLEKTPQQLLEQKMEEESKARNLQAKTMTREEIEQKKLRALQRQKEEQAAQQKARLMQPTEQIKISTGGPPRFFDSSKSNSDQPKFVNLK